eukprot:TRINITY_DN70_c0_g2_i1.p1 TRINITY_DN70_c0_g2~~TRINITY_DN70_c0_g2_i1.p1  ORF type:complete len:738 (+),score=274.91 TRINITY_DN70_c0_g2_i1:68-2281(+)
MAAAGDIPMARSMRPVVVATCNLNQWALDFTGNLRRIKDSILEAKKKGARLRVGPELETTGYGCEDHFLEDDTTAHSWEVIEEILCDKELTRDILVDIGAPVNHRNCRYNCRVYLLNGQIVLIRPKIYLANDGNYRETRFFMQWDHNNTYRVEDFYLPGRIARITGQRKVPFGVAAIAARDTVVATETCEELFTPQAPHIDLALNGVEIITNGSGSHHQLRKLNQRVDLIKSATAKSGGCYLYANQQGCDGNRLYYDGSAMVMVNGALLKCGTQFSMHDVEVVTAVVDLADIRTYRGALNSRGVQASETPLIPRIDIDFCLVSEDILLAPSPRIEMRYLDPMEELGRGPPCWMWDYLRRSGLRGYFCPLSGGADSTSTCTMARLMCDLIVQTISEERERGMDPPPTLLDIRRVTRQPEYTPTDGKELCGRVLFTCYMGTSNSSKETRDRAQALAEQLGCNHSFVEIDKMTDAVTQVYASQVPGERKPDIRTAKIGSCEDLAMQNIQARSRMVLSYLIAQLMPWKHQEGHNTGLLVLGSANVDEALRGYYTKYDCSAADINPIGGVSKVDLRAFLDWVAVEKGFTECGKVRQAVPVAELRPFTDAEGKPLPAQTDEDDMGMSYEELKYFGDLRSRGRCGPVAMFQKLVHEWLESHPHGGQFTPTEIATKVKRFWRMHAINRHKMTTLTPSYHAESYSPDDNRFDLRPFLYPVDFKWQFMRIDKLAAELEEELKKRAAK